ncbi:hypothetical protein [Streptomyces gardneri]|uniref:hypothetical protein n=1 Tax=Streptomyces gardneri TaxID=66892 RepID=UPI003F4CE761
MTWREEVNPSYVCAYLLRRPSGHEVVTEDQELKDQRVTETFNPTYSRKCACREPEVDPDGNPVLDNEGKQKKRLVGAACPRLKADKKHGTWHLYFELEAGENNTRRRVRRGGFPTKDKAKKKAAELYREAVKGTDVLSDATVGEDLEAWLKRKKSLARTTTNGYEDHVRLYLQPHLDHIKRRDCKLRHVEAMYDAIEKENAERLIHHARIVELQEARDAALREGRKGKRKVTSATTMHRLNATLRSFLGSVVKRGDYTTNWATMVELPPPKRSKALVWTPERVTDWKRTGLKPSPVMVRTPEQTGEFLDFIADDRPAAMWHGFIFRGRRRGEMCALPWSDVSLSGSWFRISAQTVEVAYRTYNEAPKQDSVRTVTLDARTKALWIAWSEPQQRERKQWSGERRGSTADGSGPTRTARRFTPTGSAGGSIGSSSCPACPRNAHATPGTCPRRWRSSGRRTSRSFRSGWGTVPARSPRTPRPGSCRSF